MTKLNAKMQLRRGADALWASRNPTLLDGELGLAQTTNYLKRGDGSTAWVDLATFCLTADPTGVYWDGQTKDLLYLGKLDCSSIDVGDHDNQIYEGDGDNLNLYSYGGTVILDNSGLEVQGEALFLGTEFDGGVPQVLIHQEEILTGYPLMMIDSTDAYSYYIGGMRGGLFLFGDINGGAGVEPAVYFVDYYDPNTIQAYFNMDGLGNLNFYPYPGQNTNFIGTLNCINGDIKVQSDVNGILIGNDGDVRISSNAAGAVFITPTAANTDLVITYVGTSNSGVMKWMEDEDWFQFDDHIRLGQVVYDDLQFPIATGKVPASNYPNWEALTTNTSAFAFGVGEYIDLQAGELPHWWKEGTAGSVHLHVAIKTLQNSGAARYAEFTVYLAYADVNEVITETSLTAELTIPDGSAALKHFLVSLGDLTLTDNLIGTQITPRVKRVAVSTGGHTEYADDIYITQVGIHLQKDALGSRSVSSK